jgi:hypothetical protein
MSTNSLISLLKEKNIPVIITGIVLAIGIWAYVTLDAGRPSMSTVNRDVAKFYGSIVFKVAFTGNKEMKVFVKADNKVLAKLPSFEGGSVPDENSMVLGFLEAQMMKAEELITGTGSRLNGFFGINTQVSGILKKTNTYVDDIHFLSQQQFQELKGYENILVLKLTPKQESKLFFLLDKSDTYPFAAKIPKPMIGRYDIRDGYYPVILGFNEAAMMIEEGLIKGKGDTIKNFFGRDAVIIGILPMTGSPLDMMHFVPKDYFGREALK